MSMQVMKKDYGNVAIIIEKYTNDELKEANIETNSGNFGFRIVDYDENNILDCEIYNNIYDDGYMYSKPEDAFEAGCMIFDSRFLDDYQ